MDPHWKELIAELGEVVEAAGRNLKRKPPHTKQDLTDLRDTLNLAASTIQMARDATFKK